MRSGLAVASISIETRTIQKVRIRILPFVFLLFVAPLREVSWPFEIAFCR